MRLIKEELKSDSQSWLWFKEFEKSLIVNLLKAQECFMTWRNTIRSTEFWNISWLWTSFLMKICTLRITFAVGQGAKRKLLSWVSGRVPKCYFVKSFPTCLQDGIVLCALTESLVPGSCPRFDLLDSGQPLRNLKLALHLVEKHIKIKPDISAHAILDGGKLAEKKLLLLMARMKLASEKFNLTVANRRTSKDYMSDTTFVSEKCFARGMGLLLAVRGRTACFTILLDSTENLDMVIEIRGPKNTVCNKRITNGLSLSRSESLELREINDDQIRENILNKRIPLTYRVLGRKISVSYTPLESGIHNMSIIWQGQHIMGSPYTITVDSSIETPDIWHIPPPQRGYSRLKRSDSLCFDESIEYTNTENSPLCLEPLSSVKKKTVLRYIVRMDGNDIVIDGKENLCEAINKIKEEQRNLSSDEDTEFYQLENSYYSSDKTKKNCKKSNDVSRSEESLPPKNSSKFKSEKIPCQEKEAISSNATKEREIKCEPKAKSDSMKNLRKTDQRAEQEIKNKSMVSNATMKANVNSESESKSINAVKIKETNQNSDVSNKLNGEITIKSKNCDIICCESKVSKKNNEYKDPITIKPDNFSEISGEKEVSDKKHTGVRMLDPENASDKTNNCNGNYLLKDSSTGSTKARSKSKVSFAEDYLTDSFPKPNNIANKSPKNGLRASIANSGSSQTSSDDVSFFPVHKVEYEILHDDEDDTDSPGEFNPKRRRSFTELNESNYLDEDDYSAANGKDENLMDEVLNCEVQELQEEFKDVKSAAIDNSLPINFSLFDCDHSLTFWSETVDETSPENTFYESEGEQNHTEQMWKNKLRELEGKPALCANEALSLNSEGRIFAEKDGMLETENSCSKDFYGFSDSENEVNCILSFSLPSLSNVCEDDQSDGKRKLNPLDLMDNRRRPSWCDRDILPSIRESSVEGLLDSDINNANCGKGIAECNNMLLGEVKASGISLSPFKTKSQNADEGFGEFVEKAPEASLSSFDNMCSSTTLPSEDLAKSFKNKKSENNCRKGITECNNMLLGELKASGISLNPFNAKSQNVDEGFGKFVEKTPEASLSYFDNMCSSITLPSENRAKSSKNKHSENNCSKGITECNNMLFGEVKASGISLSPFKPKSQNVDEGFGKFVEKTPEASLSSFDNMCSSTTLPSEDLAKSFKNKNFENKIVHIQSGIQGDSQNPVRCEDLYKNKSLPMNILSAAPYRSRMQETKQNEDSCSRTPEFENSTKQELSFSERPTSSKSSEVYENYILTYAAPVVIGECQVVDEASNKASEVIVDLDKTSQITNYHDNYEVKSYEVKSAKCLSVKKAIQIFQKEKEEPIDTWPTEIQHSKSQGSRKKYSFVNEKIGGKYEFSDTESNVQVPSSSEKNSLIDIPRSSIKDRVKLFEKEEKKENPSSIKKTNSVEKYSNCRVSAKKNYWENVSL